jgi:spore germination cell wall hydrolase CwlJ-like protein
VKRDRERDYMSLRQSWMGAALALTVLCGAAAADVSVSQSNAPTSDFAGAMSSLLGVENATLRALPEAKLAAIATGPKASQKPLKGATVIRYDAEWLAAQPAPSGDEAWACLSQAVYFEARGESIKGQFAVAEVVLNRVDSGQFAGSVCGVVNQRGGGACQFSYVCDGRADRMADPQARDIAERIAYVMLNGAPRTLTEGATYFHTNGVRPGWSRRFERTAAIGDHLFYRRD